MRLERLIEQPERSRNAGEIEQVWLRLGARALLSENVSLRRCKDGEKEGKRGQDQSEKMLTSQHLHPHLTNAEEKRAAASRDPILFSAHTTEPSETNTFPPSITIISLEPFTMTLTTSTSVPSPQGDSPQYLIFFSSGTPPWCPDCVDAQPAIQAVFGGAQADAHIVLVGEKPEWKTPENRFRKEFGIRCIPSITKMINVSIEE